MQEIELGTQSKVGRKILLIKGNSMIIQYQKRKIYEKKKYKRKILN